MKKATVTYTAPEGENKVLTIAGTTLLSGKSDTVICEEAAMKRLQAAAGDGKGMLKVDGVTDYTPPKEPPPKEPPPKHDDDKPKGKAA